MASKFARASAFGSLAFGFLSASSAWAQDASTSADSVGLDEVVVTAQKREENLQTTPIAITVLSASTIETLGVNNNKDLFGNIAGLVGFEPVSSRGNLSLNIRGVPSGNASNLSNDPATALYVDGVYVPKGFGVGLDVMDVARMEVLRGPQGTLYGRNTTGGAVNIISRKPSGDFRLDARVGGGNYGLKDYRLAVDLPAVGGLSSTIGYFKRERDPLYGNTNPNIPGSENLDRQGWRAALRFSNSDSFSADYTYTHSELEEFSQATKVIGLNPNAGAVAGAPGFPTGLIPNSTSRSAQLAGLQSALALLGPAAATPEVQQLSRWITDYRNWESQMYAQGLGRPRNISQDTPLMSSNDVDAHGLTLTWNREGLGILGDVEFKSITGYRKVENLNQGDLDGVDGTVRPLGNGQTTGVIHDLILSTIGGLFFNQVSPAVPGAVEFQAGQAIVNAINAAGRSGTFNLFAGAELKNYSQELQMVGESGRLQYATGLFYFKDEGKFRNNSRATFPLASSFTSSYDNGTEAWAAYGQGTWRASDSSPFSLTTGLRYTKEKKEITYLHRSSPNALQAAFGALFTPGGSVATAAAALAKSYVSNENAETQTPVAGVFGRSFSEDFDNLSGKITLAYDFNDATHGYATVSTGFKSGSYLGDTFESDVNGNVTLIRPEEMTNFEVGLKADVTERLRVNLALYSYNYKDMHVSTLLVRPNGTIVSRIQNAGRAKRSGGELEVAFRPTENFRGSIFYAGISGDFDEYPVVQNATKVISNTVDFAKRGLAPNAQVGWNFDWRIAKQSNATWDLNVNGSWQLPNYSQALASDTNYAAGPVIFEQFQNDERTLVNARLSVGDIKLGNSTLRISAWGRNLTDADYREFAFNYGSNLGINLAQYGESRTYGVDFAILFGEK